MIAFTRPMLTDKVRVEQASEELEPEDILAEAASLFPDDTRNAHGDPGSVVVYSSRFSDLRLTVADPGREDDRKLFAHYLWNASIYCADMIESGQWDVKGQKVLELGAGE